MNSFALALLVIGTGVAWGKQLPGEKHHIRGKEGEPLTLWANYSGPYSFIEWYKQEHDYQTVIYTKKPETSGTDWTQDGKYVVNKLNLTIPHPTPGDSGNYVLRLNVQIDQFSHTRQYWTFEVEIDPLHGRKKTKRTTTSFALPTQQTELRTSPLSPPPPPHHLPVIITLAFLLTVAATGIAAFVLYRRQKRKNRRNFKVPVRWNPETNK